MTLPELKDKLKVLNLPIAYRCFAAWLSARAFRTLYTMRMKISGFYADDTVYYEGYAVTIEVYTDQKDLQLERKSKGTIKQ